MNLGSPAPRYSTEYEAARNREIEGADMRNLKRQQDIEMASGAKLVLYAPNGSRWALTVSNAGVLAAVKQ